MAIDPQLIEALHLEAVRHGALADERAVHVAFQTSTLAALLDGAYDGDLTIGELRRHGDLGLGTFDGLNGEMVMIDGEVWRARVDGTVERAGDDERTPFAVVTPFAAEVTVVVERELSHEELLALATAQAPPGSRMQALRFDGRLAAVHARSVPRQPEPYLPLVEAARSQREFMLEQLDGSLVGFCFPASASGIELPGFHLHAIAADRSRGGHVLSARVGPGVLQLGALTDLHMELPPGIELPDAAAGGDADDARARERADALDRLEHDPGCG
jgi:acetolactate decarboxylase